MHTIFSYRRRRNINRLPNNYCAVAPLYVRNEVVIIIMLANMIRCPLMNEQIEDSVCFDISMVVEHLAPNYTMPAEIKDIED